MTQIIVPSPDEILVSGINSLVALRPNALPHINDGFPGTYGEVFVGWRGQITEQVAHLADYVKNGRLKLAEGDALKALCASEFDSLENDQPTKSVGYAILYRPTTLTSGVIPKGTRFTRPFTQTNSNNYVIGVTEATYVSTHNIQVNVGDNFIYVSLEAEQVGSFTNTPIGGVYPGTASPQPPIPTIADPLFDTFQVYKFSSAGGSDGVTDIVRRRYAKAFYTGQFGPTLGSIIAGTFKDGSVKNAVFRENTTTAKTEIYIADSSWGASLRWIDLMTQRLHDEGWVGFGSRIQVGAVVNIFLSISANVTLKKTQYLNDTSDVLQDIQSAVRSYFDNRPDWNNWKLEGIKAAIFRANRKIQTCQSVTVTGFNPLTNQSVTEPTADTLYIQSETVYKNSPSFTNTFVTFRYTPQGAVTVNFLSPL